MYFRYRSHQIGLLIGSIILTVIVVVVIAVGLRFSVSSDYSNRGELFYSPTDTRVIPFSRAFCQGVTLITKDPDDRFNISLYRLSSVPKLTGHETFSFSGELDFSKYNYNHYLFYLHEGSTFTVSACYAQAGNRVHFYLIKGYSRYNQWTYYPTTSYAEKDFEVTDFCSSSTNKTHIYTILSPGYYYMTFLTRRMFTSDFNTHFTFNRTLYEFANESITESCSMGSNEDGDCNVGIPLSGSSTALVTVQPLDEYVDWTAHIAMRTKCNHRVWVYVIVVLFSVATGVITPLAVLVCVCACLRRRKRSQKYTSLSSDPTSVTSYPPRVDGSMDRALPSITPDLPSTTYGINA